ncbi:nicolin-1 isoform X2 [Aplysia californica]|uniref:Nicolin-1 isoform X2 n=1 Tax=Aplysia californica TaxID=6500 RepID=A0ABM0K2N4_APLCA|nr:nicolin-1 isoform X2 [Aplysia californica]
MNDKPLSCTIKPAVCVTADTKGFHSGCKIVDISFPSIVNPEIGEIRFQNFYVAFLTVKAKIKLTEDTPREGPQDQGWRVALRRFPLMPDPHGETGAQDSFCLTRKHFSCDLSNIVSVRLILQQPAPVWKEFKMEELKLFRSSNGVRVPPLPTWVTEDDKTKVGKKELENENTGVVAEKNSRAEVGVPDIDSLSASLQQLWALAEEASSNQTEESLGRYEVEGCYDINLLAYS